MWLDKKKIKNQNFMLTLWDIIGLGEANNSLTKLTVKKKQAETILLPQQLIKQGWDNVTYCSEGTILTFNKGIEKVLISYKKNYAI